VGLSSARRDELRKIAAQAGAYKKDDLGKLIVELGIKATLTGNDLTPPFEFNLMFQTMIGPTGTVQGFLRPEPIQMLWRQHLTGRYDHTTKLWTVLMWQAWLEQWG
jgi:glycyl-tRNA synthetase (class II)